jgi:hypothetical protein
MTEHFKERGQHLKSPKISRSLGLLGTTSSSVWLGHWVKETAKQTKTGEGPVKQGFQGHGEFFFILS